MADGQGPVAAVDASGGTLVVLGQTVETGADTVFDLGARPAAVASLAVGEVVRVSGFVGVDGVIFATRVEQREPSAELRVLGEARGLDRAALRFTINGLTVSYAAAVSIDGFPSGGPEDGDDVVAVGTAFGPGGELLAQTLALLAPAIDRDEGEELEIEGRITRFASLTDFDVAGVSVTTSSATRFEGEEPARLALDAKVHVKGRVDAAQRLVARLVEIEDIEP